jgi:enolase-phosphatase E1
MISFAGRGILLDIEGTTSSIAFVVEVLFPFARRRVESYLRRHWHHPPTIHARAQIDKDARTTFPADVETGLAPLCREVVRLMDGDVKATGLKELQGLIWQEGYYAGELRSHVYPDVPAALRQWTEARRDVRIYSSGSVAAQKVFFAHTSAGNLLALLRGHYDTNVGPKGDAQSYCKIVADMRLSPGEVMFLSDVVAELDAAKAAGLRTSLVVRPGNSPVPEQQTHPVITDFGQIEIE